MKSIFLIKTPLQLLNAIEAKRYFNINTADSILVLMADRKSQSQLYQLASNENSWGDVVDLNDESLLYSKLSNNVNKKPFIDKIFKLKIFKRSFFYIIKLNKLALTISEAEYIFVGHAKYMYMRHFSNILKHKKTVLLDDGNATIKIAKERMANIKLASTIRRKSKIKLFFKKKIHGLNDNEYKDLTYFTIYDIVCGSNDQIVKNTYKHIRSDINDHGISDAVYFVGSPISETRILSQEKYIEYLKRIKIYYKSKKIFYISHRRESPENLAAISESIGIEVIGFEYPLEYQLAVIGPRPKVLASFISSALDSCSLIFGNKIQIVAFEVVLSEGPFQEEIKSIYENYRMSENNNILVESNY